MYGPVRTVVWEGRSCEAPPYPDQSAINLFPLVKAAFVFLMPYAGKAFRPPGIKAMLELFCFVDDIPRYFRI